MVSVLFRTCVVFFEVSIDNAPTRDNEIMNECGYNLWRTEGGSLESDDASLILGESCPVVLTQG